MTKGVVGVLGKVRQDLFLIYNLNLHGSAENIAVHFEPYVCNKKDYEYFFNLLSQKTKVSYMNKDFMELGFYLAHFIREPEGSAGGSVLIFASREANCSDINGHRHNRIQGHH